ncbi:anhydro-N-acetylmuramic acid kinase [Candidatus Thioglobus sp.]|uniref:anhydro-N-acetylmuramic acid kinase n=1 Tax=Candidatus Thioglobus sp. TaxID=2026721 RepID=UPI003D0E5B5B
MANAPQAQYYIGLMSGTSLDGVDGVIVDSQCQKIIAQTYQPYPAELKQSLRQLTQSGQTALSNLATIDIKVAQVFASTALLLLKESGILAAQIIAIGSHGQTIYHHGGQYSMQIAHGALLAEQTSITTVADFRMQDVASGGQGAPLTPLYHQHLLKNQSGVVINLGGIANITLLTDGLIAGFDTGPANTLLDNWINQQQSLDYDDGGLWAKSGRIDQSLLGKLLADVYFQQQAPKSTGPEYFNLEWLTGFLTGAEPAKDVQRTLLELTIVSISKHIPNNAKVYLCGGGVRNGFLIERLIHLNPNNDIKTTDELGMHTDYVEAAAFAYFAKRTLAKKTSNLTAVTGAKSARILGAIYAT